VSARPDRVPRTVAFPLQLRPDGPTRTVDTRRAVVEQLLEQLLFTNPGERVNRPTLGCGLLQAVFAPLDDALLTATQYRVKAEVQAWLGDLVRNVTVDLDADDEAAKLAVSVQYELAGVDGVTTVRFSA
jgi:hypothetical protein